MTKGAIASALLAIILFSASSVLALDLPASRQDATSPGTTRKDLLQPNIQSKIDEMRVKMASREAALKLKLQSFRNQKKATAAARISDNLNKINSIQTNQMLKYLNKMTAILNKLEDRVNRGTPDIKDATKARAAIADARTKIASAEAAVKDQAAKDYTITVSSESTVKADAKTVRDKLHADLLALRKQVIEAKQAVGNAIRVAKSGKVEIPKKEGTPSGQ